MLPSEHMVVLLLVLYGIQGAAAGRSYLCRTGYSVHAARTSLLCWHAGGYVKSIVSLGWAVWTCNSKTMQVYTDQGSLIGSQEAAADLASKLTAAESREAALKAALTEEQAGRESEAALAASKDAKMSADMQAAADKVTTIVPDATHGSIVSA